MSYESTSHVYARLDERGNILQIEGEYSLANIRDYADWTLIEEGPSCSRLNRAQVEYLPKGLYTEDGIPRYVYEDGAVRERTETEIEADRAAIPPAPPTQAERMEAQVAYTAMMTDTLLEV